MKKIVIEKVVKIIDDNIEDILDKQKTEQVVNSFSVQNIILPANAENIKIQKPLASSIDYEPIKTLIIKSDVVIYGKITEQGQDKVLPHFKEMEIAGESIAPYGNLYLSNYNDTIANVKVIIGINRVE